MNLSINLHPCFVYSGYDFGYPVYIQGRNDMDLRNLEENRERIINEFSEEMNSGDARHIRYEINWLLSKADNNRWDTFEDAYKERISEKHYSEITKSNKKYYFRCICKKLCPDSVFAPRIYCHCEETGDMVRLSKGYRELDQEYRGLLDAYVALAKNAGKKRDTIFTHCNLTAGLLRHFQRKDIRRLEEATEDSVMSFFMLTNSMNVRSGATHTKKN